MNFTKNLIVGAVRMGRILSMTQIEINVLDQLSKDLDFNYTVRNFKNFIPRGLNPNCSEGKFI